MEEESRAYTFLVRRQLPLACQDRPMYVHYLVSHTWMSLGQANHPMGLAAVDSRPSCGVL